MFEDVPHREYRHQDRIGDTMKIEILAKKGPTLTSFELREPGILRVVLQMGTPRDAIQTACTGVLHEQVLNRVIRLWAENDCERGFLEQGRHLLISESE
jgi:hypothetical protein